MTFDSQPEVLRVSGLPEITAANAAALRDQARAALRPQHSRIDLDLSQTRFVDSSGLGALIALQKTMNGRQGHLRLLDPTPPVQQVLELTRMHRIFEIATR